MGNLPALIAAAQAGTVETRLAIAQATAVPRALQFREDEFAGGDVAVGDALSSWRSLPSHAMPDPKIGPILDRMDQFVG